MACAAKGTVTTVPNGPTDWGARRWAVSKQGAFSGCAVAWQSVHMFPLCDKLQACIKQTATLTDVDLLRPCLLCWKGCHARGYRPLRHPDRPRHGCLAAHAILQDCIVSFWACS